MKTFKGIVHVHSNYSYDGQHSLEEIAEMGKNRGYHFIGMSEHSDTFDEEKIARYVKECKNASTENCLIIPGIEFTCENNLHILGLGVRQYTSGKDPFQIARFIRQQGGVAVIAHPVRYHYQIPEGLAAVVDGIEVWNAGYDGRFVPNDLSLALLRNLKDHGGGLYAFGGQDLHQIIDHCHVQIAVLSDGAGAGEILKSLKEGTFRIVNPYFKLDGRHEVSLLNLTRIAAARRIYEAAKRIRDGWVRE